MVVSSTSPDRIPRGLETAAEKDYSHVVVCVLWWMSTPEGGRTMYGTVAKTKVAPENREKIRAVMQDQMTQRSVPGFVTSYVLYENDSDTAWLFAIFEDRESYDRNADDPAQDADYQAYRALMDADPEWHDGMIERYDS